MPTYAYACTACGHDFETVQSFHEDSLTECPQCQGRLRKVFSNVGVVFKGSGFYRNDSRTSADKPGEKTGEKASEKASDKSTDKPAEKSATTSSDGGSSSKSAATTSGSTSASRSGSAA